MEGDFTNSVDGDLVLPTNCEVPITWVQPESIVHIGSRFNVTVSPKSVVDGVVIAMMAVSRRY
jgi:hypothetical protein